MANQYSRHKMTDSPLFLVLMLGVSLYLAKIWRDDLKAAESGAPNPRGLPGAAPAPVRSWWLAAVGALIILAAETFGESILGLSAEQTDMTVLFGVYTLAAPIVEEIVFRGYFIVLNRGRGALWGGIFAASLLFALLHPFLWKWDNEGFRLTMDAKGWFTTTVLFVSSLWFYYVRIATWNPQRSLLPCFVAHFAKNAGVFAIKAVQGHVVGLW